MGGSDWEQEKASGTALLGREAPQIRAVQLEMGNSPSEYRAGKNR